MSARDFAGLSFSELLFRLKMADRERVEADKNRLIAAAFGAWLNGSAGDKKSFPSYLQDLGLIKRVQISKKQKEDAINKAHRIAERIMAMDKPRVKARKKCGKSSN